MSQEKSTSLELFKEFADLKPMEATAKYQEKVLSKQPNPKNIRRHPMVKIKNTSGQFENMPYLPIEAIENNLDMIFPGWHLEVLREGQIANSVYVAIRLFLTHPITGENRTMDGLGAAPLQTDKGANATEWEKIKNDAVMKALPAAESYALKDAAEKLGRVFGRNLSRADDPAFVNVWDSDPIN